MAKYSVELRKIVESGINVFNFPYAFYDESKREEFERHFIEHFYFREIGAETVDRFRWYLKDKMNTVFPYYNELFNAAQIEYNILDNYNIKEEYTIEREQLEKGNAVSSNVGRTKDQQTSETDETRSSETTDSNTLVGSRTDKETLEGSTSENVTENGSNSGTVNEDSERSGNNVKKYLDTPQGKLDLSSTDYLTNLTNVDDSETNQKETTQSGTSENTKNATGSNDSERNLTGSTNQTSNGESANSSEGKVINNTSSEQTATHDNNTRTERIGSQKEKSTYTKRGNIGVDTDSDMIQKHINLQKVLRNIEKMFFDECEDLFMLVY